MKREWQPGDVAMSRYGRVFYSGNEFRGSWTFDDGSGGFGSGFRPLQEIEPADARPLVVIDPEDPEQVMQLLRGYCGWKDLGGIEDHPHYVTQMQAALREFANPTPPKPDEPLGLGAVVVDVEGKRYVRCAEGHERWHCPDDDSGASDGFYEGIPAVKVLSEGVTA